jgi:hypothetical protein
MRVGAWYGIEAAGPVPWEEVCRIVPRIDPAREPDRARWMVGWRHLLRRLH